MSIEVLDLFSAAAGGWSLGMHRAGYRTLAACEVEAWRRALYSENNPGVKVYDDVRTLSADRLLADLGRLPSVVVGSPPCQDISSANTKGRGVEGERSGLYFEAIRIIGEVRPRWFALENSANLRTRGADAVLSALEAIGYACWAVVVRAGDIGANHERPRCWLVGCDVEQIADPDGIGWHEGRGWGRSGLDLPVPTDPQHPTRVGHEGRRARGHGPDGHGSAHSRPSEAADASRIGRLARAGDDEGSRREADGHEFADGAASGSAGGHASDAYCDAVRLAVVSGGSKSEAPLVGDTDQGRSTPDADQAGQADGCMVPGLRQAEIADDGRGAGRCHDGSSAGQMGICPADRGDAIGGGPVWSLGNLADHLWLDDGLSARLAGTRIHVGDGKGQSGASAIVEAFGDAVVPQIPEAIGRAILRVETALAAIYRSAAA